MGAPVVAQGPPAYPFSDVTFRGAAEGGSGGGGGRLRAGVPLATPVPFSGAEGMEGGDALCRAGHTSTVVGTSLFIMFGFRKPQDGKEKKYLSDVLRFTPEDSSWMKVGELGAGRGHHTATLVGSRIWVIGGQDSKYIFDGVLCFDVETLRWVNPETERSGGFHIRWPRTRDGHSLARRTCHTATLHPHNPKAIIVAGGISLLETGSFAYRSDVFMLDTITGQVQLLARLDAGVAFHSAVTFRSSVLLVAGDRGGSSNKNASVLEMITPIGSQWRASNPVMLSGHDMLKLSSHTVAEYKGMLFCLGGLRGRKHRINDLLCLRVSSGGGWECLKVADVFDERMEGRAAHTVSVINDTMYIFGGCTGSRLYSGKMWRLDLAAVVRQVNMIPLDSDFDFMPSTSQPNLHAHSVSPCSSAPAEWRGMSGELKGGTMPKMTFGQYGDASQKKRRVVAKRSASPEVPREVPRGTFMRSLSDIGALRGQCPDLQMSSVQSTKAATIGEFQWPADQSVELGDSNPVAVPQAQNVARPLDNQAMARVKENLERLSLEKEHLGTQLSQAELTSDQRAKENEELKRELEELRAVNKTQEAAIKEHEATIDDQANRIEVLVTRQDDKDEGLEELRATSSSTIRELQQRIADLEEEVTEAQENAKRSLKDYEVASNEIMEEMEATLGQNQIKVAQQHTKITQLGVQVAELETQIAQKEMAIVQREGTIAELGNKLTMVEPRVAELEGALERRETEAAQLKEDNAKLRGEVEEAAQKGTDGQVLLDRYATEKENWSQQLRDARTELDAAKRERGACEEQLDELREKHESAQKEHDEAVRDFEHLCCALRNDLNGQLAEQQVSLEQEMGALRDQLQKKDIAIQRMREDNAVKMAEFDDLRSLLDQQMNLQLTAIQATKDEEIAGLRQGLEEKDRDMQNLKSECDAKVSAKCRELEELAEQHKKAALDREALMQECQSAQACIACEREERAAKLEASAREIAKLQEAVKKRDTRLLESEEEHTAALGTLGQSMANQRLNVQSLAKQYVSELLEAEARHAQEIDSIILHVNK